MNISKFLLTDAALVMGTMTLLFLIQGGKKNSPLFLSSNKKEFLKQTSSKPPTKEKLITLEKLAKDYGSGIEFDSLVGDWKFISIWKNEIDEEDSIFSSLLRFFSANIEFKKDLSTDDLSKFSVITSVRFGLFTIDFSGSGYLKGEQPLLPFFFNLIELKSGSNVLLRRSLKEPVEKEKIFFALIALEENGEWLSARGQGGALLLWKKG